MIEIDRRDLIAGLGGAAAVGLMSHEARADALEDALNERLELAQAPPGSGGGGFPTSAEIEAQIPTRGYRRGTGTSFLNTNGENVPMLPPLPASPTLFDFYDLRFTRQSNHCLQSANKAMERGADEEIILACLLHDTVQTIMRTDHGYWGAQLFEPYVPERTSFAIKYHQALRFYPDEEAGYVYPDLYRRIFGEDYVPAAHIRADWDMLRNHGWYDAPREVTVSDLYAFDPDAVVTMDPFVDIVGRHFKQPEEGLGNDNSPVAHMWRTIANPDAPL
ncbi:hypothetical protein [Candidatus Rariloculus sp.]|uniref:hypothetical protein n=1 Tax=Candidatus Rariloculus sp. TaxID=3101265 RepID=UPI003D0F1F2A